MKRGFDRKQRVGDLIQQALARILIEETSDARFRLVTVTGVTVSRDLSSAKVFVSVLMDDPAEIKQVLDDLNQAAGMFRFHLTKAVKLRITPELRFAYDESTSHGFKISSLINSAMKKTDKKD